jgi:hypothetical protein
VFHSENELEGCEVGVGGSFVWRFFSGREEVELSTYPWFPRASFLETAQMLPSTDI